MCLFQLLILIRDIFLSDLWLSVAPRYQKETFSKEFGVNWTMYSKYDNYSRLNSQYNLGGPDLMSMRIINKIFIRAPKIMRNVIMALFIFAKHLVLIVCFIYQEKWASREKVTI
jgi:hypothetical protein